MKTINVYFGATTKVQMGHLVVEDDVNIEDLIQTWLKQGYAKIHYMNNTIFIYVPWGNVTYCQYASRADANQGI